MVQERLMEQNSQKTETVIGTGTVLKRNVNGTVMKRNGNGDLNGYKNENDNWKSNGN